MDLLTIAKKIADRAEAVSLKQNAPDAMRRHSAGNALSLNRLCPAAREQDRGCLTARATWHTNSPATPEPRS